MRLAVAALLSFLVATTVVGAAPAPDARIAIEPIDNGRWQADYALPRPTTRMVFARNPDDSRAKAWVPVDPAFEILRIDGLEQVRRRDGSAFTAVSLTLAPVYVDLPKDYAPFSSFTDGGLLFHSGRFFACADICPEKPRYTIGFTGHAGDRILVKGRSVTGRAIWTDGADGTAIYIGQGHPIETSHVLAVIDPGLPQPVRDPLSTSFPRFMDYFTGRLGAPRPKPMLFASYDPGFAKGYGSQGGTLPGQVFIHYYGPGWPARMAERDFVFRTAFFFAHEAAHLHQAGGQPIDTSWINEGGAEIFAARALAALVPESAGWLRTKLAAARASCTKALPRTKLSDAMKNEQVDMLYECGLTINARIDHELRMRDPGSDGIFTLWKIWRTRVLGGMRPTEENYATVVEAVGGKPLADWVRRIAFEGFADETAAGAVVGEGAPEEIR